MHTLQNNEYTTAYKLAFKITVHFKLWGFLSSPSHARVYKPIKPWLINNKNIAKWRNQDFSTGFLFLWFVLSRTCNFFLILGSTTIILEQNLIAWLLGHIMPSSHAYEANSKTNNHTKSATVPTDLPAASSWCSQWRERQHTADRQLMDRGCCASWHAGNVMLLLRRSPMSPASRYQSSCV